MAVCCFLVFNAFVVLSGSSAASRPQQVRRLDDAMHVFFLLDRSGSMHAIADDVVGSFNSYLHEQRRSVGGSLKLTLAQFDTQEPFKLVHDAMNITEVSDLTQQTFQPRGGTPLYDAMASLVRKADNTVASRKEAGLPSERVVLVILTDGL